MNKAIITGRLVADPEIRYTQGNEPIAIARYRLAVDRRFKKEGEQTADFIPCIAFSKLAEFAKNYLKKGTKIAVTGRIQTGDYTNKDGQMVYSVRVMVDEVEFAESKNASAGNDGGFGGGFNSGYAGGNSTPAPSGAGDGFMNIPDGIDEELPFN